MKEISPHFFFNLASFEHKKLFDAQKPVWHALTLLKPYLETFPFGKIEVEIPPGVTLVDAHLISIGKGSVVEPGAYIKGPCIIGKDCIIRHGAYIRGDLITGDRCVIGHDTEVKHSIFLDDAHAAHFAYVGDSILGNRINFGAGTICANLKFDKKEVFVFINSEKIQTGLRKLGAIVGDDVQTGCNCVLSPGTFLSKGVWCYPTTNINGFIPENSSVKREETLSIIKREQKKT